MTSPLAWTSESVLPTKRADLPAATIQAINAANAFGFCPTRKVNTRSYWVYVAGSLCHLLMTTFLLFDVLRFYFRGSTDSNFWGGFFSSHSITTFLYLFLALHACTNQLINLLHIWLGTWEGMLATLCLLPDNMSTKCTKTLKMHSTIWSRLLIGVFTALGVYMFWCAIFPAHRDFKGHMGPQVQSMFAVAAVLTPTVLLNTLAKQLVLQFQRVVSQFQVKRRATAVSTASSGVFSNAHALILYDDYVKLANAVEAFSGAFSAFLMVNVIVSMITGTFAVYKGIGILGQVLFKHLKLDFLLAIYITIQLLCCLSTFISGFQLNEESRGIRRELRTLPMSRFDERTKETLELLKEYVNDPDWGVTVGSFYYIDRSTLLMVAGIVFAHVILIMEITVFNEVSETATNGTENVMSTTMSTIIP